MKEVFSVRIEAHVFREADLVAGHPALDFVNTVAGRNGTPRDWLDRYARLLDWARLARLLSGSAIDWLARAAEAHPEAAVAALARARQLRETLFHVFSALAHGRSCERRVLDALAARWVEAAGRSTLLIGDGALRIGMAEGGDGLDAVADRLALAAIDFARDPPAGRLRTCAGDNCGWLFIDRSKAGRRRWCDMNTCGNHAKYRRHAARSRWV